MQQLTTITHSDSSKLVDAHRMAVGPPPQALAAREKVGA